MFDHEDSVKLQSDDYNANEDAIESLKLSEKEPEAARAKFQLKKTVGLIEGISLIVGIMIGSGIFASPRSVARNAKSVGMSLVVWGGCGLISIFGALSYLELGLMFQGSGKAITLN